MFLNLRKNLQYCFLFISLLFLVACDSAKVKDTTKPVFTSKSRVSIKENTTAVFTVKSTDRSNVIYSITGGEDKAQFTISTSGQLSFKTAPNFESPTDKDKKNTYIVKITATDSAKNIASQTIIVTVKDIDESKPVFTSLNTKTIIEGQIKVLTITATDESTVTYAISGGEDALKFIINAQTGELNFKIAPSFDSPSDNDKNNSYISTITATDTVGNSATQTITIHIIENIIDMSGDFTIKYLGKGSSYDNLVVDMGNLKKTLYILFTNHNSTTETTPVISHNAKNIPNLHSKIISKKTINAYQPLVSHAPQYIKNFNTKSHKLFTKEKTQNLINFKNITPPHKKNIVGDSQKLVTDIYFKHPNHDDGDIKTTTDATVRKVVLDTNTQFGPKTLYIWVSDDSFDSSGDGTNCDKSDNYRRRYPNSTIAIECITPTLVDNLADKFLKQGDNNDTYDWVTNIYGEEWGVQNPSNSFIQETNEISILLTDIDNDDKPNGGVIGLFYSKDNFKKASLAGSNEKVMFYIDSIMYANVGGGDTWQKAVYATLAHEFTHMIEFYQKDTKSADWLAEMTAEATEYITSNKVQHNSPRGLPYNEGSAGSPKNIYDRYPDYNKYNNTLSLTPKEFLGRPEEYSQASAFGAFLVNNYGGSTLLHNIMHSAETSEQAIVDAVKATTGKSDISFGDILRDWGIAVLLSDKIINSTNDAPRYNTGDFSTTSHNGVDYNIGSINFFNYVKGHNPQNNQDTGPTISKTMKTIMPHGNFFYSVGEKLTGKVTINLNVNENTEATLIAK